MVLANRTIPLRTFCLRSYLREVCACHLASCQCPSLDHTHLIKESLREVCIVKVDGLAVVLLILEGQLKFDLVDFALGDLRLHVGFIFSQLTPPQRVVPNQLLLHGAVLHDSLTIVAVLRNLLLQGRYFLLLIRLQLLFVGPLTKG